MIDVRDIISSGELDGTHRIAYKRNTTLDIGFERRMHNMNEPFAGLRNAAQKPNHVITPAFIFLEHLFLRHRNNPGLIRR